MLTNRAAPRPGKSRIRTAALALTTSSALLLTACGGGGATGEGSAVPDSAGYTYAIAQDFSGVDRAAYSSEASKTLADIMHSRLLELKTDDSSADACLSTTPTEVQDSSPLVKSWKTTADGKGIDITLRSGVVSAAGNTLTSADVEWTIDRIKAIDAGGQTLWFSVGGFDPDDTITVKSDTEFTLNLTRKSSLAPYALAGVAGMIYDSTAAKEHATTKDPWASTWLKDHTANFGPWQLSSYSAQQLVFTQNKNYTAERGNLGKVTVQTVSDASARLQLVQSGQVAETNGMDYAQLEQLKKSSAVNLVDCGTPARDWLGLNSEDPVLGKEKVRQAVSAALDREALVKAVYRDFAEPSRAGLSYTYKTTGGQDYYTYDVAKAKKLLSEAGYPDGFTMTLSVSPAQPGTYAQNLAALVQQQLGKAGITVEIKTVPSAVDFKAQGLKHSMQAWLMAETPAFANAGYSGWLTAGSDGLQNYMGYSSDELDSLTEQLMTEGDDSELADRLSALIGTEQPAVYLADRTSVSVRSTCVKSVPTSAFSFDLTQAVSACG